MGGTNNHLLALIKEIGGEDDLNFYQTVVFRLDENSTGDLFEHRAAFASCLSILRF